MKLNERQKSIYNQIIGAAKLGKMDTVNWMIKSLNTALRVEDKYKVITNKEICELLEIFEPLGVIKELNND